MENLAPKLIQLFNRYPNVSDDEMALIYSDKAVFEDPIVRIEGLENIISYFRKMYLGVLHCQFECTSSFEIDGNAAIKWFMQLKHRALNNGKLISLHGCSIIQYSDRIQFHRDYFDVGEMVYENLPILRSIIKRIKSRIH